MFQGWSLKLNQFGGRYQGQTHRGLWGQFLAEQRIMPRKLAAARIGMTIESWNRVTPAMLKLLFAVPASLDTEDFVPLTGSIGFPRISVVLPPRCIAITMRTALTCIG